MKQLNTYISEALVKKHITTPNFITLEKLYNEGDIYVLFTYKWLSQGKITDGFIIGAGSTPDECFKFLNDMTFENVKIDIDDVFKKCQSINHRGVNHYEGPWTVDEHYIVVHRIENKAFKHIDFTDKDVYLTYAILNNRCLNHDDQKYFDARE